MNGTVPIFRAVCGVGVLTLWAFTIYKMFTADYTQRPSDSILKSEFSPFHEDMGGRIKEIQNATRHVIEAQGPLDPEERQELTARFSRTAELNGWTKVSERAFERKFCKRRLSLFLDIVEDPASPRVEYGIYWTVDRASLLYCGESSG